jgi:HD-like signal output (HDOD) protein
MQKRVLFVGLDLSQKKKYVAELRPEENGLLFVFASSVKEAMDECGNQPFDIVISATQLREESGLALLETIRDTYPETIRFLLVNKAEQLEMRSMISAAQQLLVRPIKQERFILQVNRALALHDLIQGPANLKALGDIEALPPLPRIFQEISRILSNPQSPLLDVAELISQDIVLSSQVLKMANSALFSLRVPAQSVMQALPLLGSGAVSNLVFNQSMGDTFSGSETDEAFFEELNWHAIACATATTRILARWGADRLLIEKSVFCGIAHDLGKLLFAHYVPEKWRQVQDELKKGEKTDVELERAFIGLAHPELAAYLLAEWGFPDEQIIAIGFHEEPSRLSEPERGLMCALHIAENCCTLPPQKENYDWDYLAKNHVTQAEVDEIKEMLGYENSCQY